MKAVEATIVQRSMEVAQIEQRYATYLREERGLAPASLHTYSWYVRCFLRACADGTAVDLVNLNRATIERYVAERANNVSKRSVQLLTCSLRSLLGFMHKDGLLSLNLVGAVPVARSWSHAELPRYVSAAEVERIVAACDASTVAGRRDRAIVLLMARLGLRAREILALRLDDIDWRRAVILIRGKGKLHDWMPLPDDVGAAIVDHLRDSTVRTARNVFVTQGPNGGAPYGSPWFVNIALRNAARRAGVQPRGKWIGTHLLSHSLATRLLSQGASLQEIGVVLRHRTADATTIYAKVDIEGLRALARPWPVEVR